MAIWQKPADVATLNDSLTPIDGVIGLKIDRLGADFIEASFTVQKNLLQPFGLLHGGISCVVGETLGSIAANLALPPGQVAVGVHLGAHHLKKATHQEEVKATVAALKCGRRQQIFRTTLVNQAQELLSEITLTTYALDA